MITVPPASGKYAFPDATKASHTTQHAISLWDAPSCLLPPAAPTVAAQAPAASLACDQRRAGLAS